MRMESISNRIAMVAVMVVVNIAAAHAGVRDSGNAVAQAQTSAPAINVSHAADMSSSSRTAASNIDSGTWKSFGGISNGCSGSIWAMAAAANGDIYVGGNFSACGGVAAHSIARWDGSSWSALGDGTNGYVYAIAVSGNDVYVTGSFQYAGDVAADNVAHWNGSAWSGLGSGLGYAGAPTNGPGAPIGHAIAVSGDDVYVGGAFDLAGGVSVNSIARWNVVSQVWSALGNEASNGMTSGLYLGEVDALVIAGTTLYVGGGFSSAGGIAGGNIAAWNGSTWTTLGQGVNGAVLALAIFNNQVYAGGTFTRAGDGIAWHIARWDGAAWAALDNSVDQGTNNSVLAMAASPDGLYIGGRFTHAGGIGVGYMALWNGSYLSDVAGGVSATQQAAYAVNAIAVAQGKTYAGGSFGHAGGIQTNYIAAWDGNAWSALQGATGDGLAAEAKASASYAGSTCFGGFFSMMVEGHGNFACWNGSAWVDLGNGLTTGGYATAMATAGQDLYLAGWLTPANTTGCCVERWDGTSVNALGTEGVDDEVDAIAVSGSTVYVGGYFSMAGTQPAGGVASWDGSSWRALGAGVDTSVNALAVVGGKVYAGGQFQNAGGVAANHIAMWDGNTWAPVGGGVDGPVFALLAVGNQLYVGGSFDHAGGLVANSLARWDGAAWHSVGTTASGVSFGTAKGIVNALASNGSTVFIGGAFDQAGGIPANAVARWDGSAFTSLGGADGIGGYGRVYTLSVTGSQLFLGGRFGEAGGAVSSNVAAYTPDAIFKGAFE
jgi:hypothetical protein